MDQPYDFEERLLSDARGYLTERPDLYERLRNKALSSKGKLQWRVLDELLAKELLPRLLRMRRLQDSDAYNAVMDNLPLLDEMVTVMKRSPNPRTRVEAFPLVADMLVRHDWKALVNMLGLFVLRAEIPRVVDEIEEDRDAWFQATRKATNDGQGGMTCI